jgi:hypothetical protein
MKKFDRNYFCVKFSNNERNLDELAHKKCPLFFKESRHSFILFEKIMKKMWVLDKIFLLISYSNVWFL